MANIIKFENTVSGFVSYYKSIWTGVWQTMYRAACAEHTADRTTRAERVVALVEHGYQVRAERREAAAKVAFDTWFMTDNTTIVLHDILQDNQEYLCNMTLNAIVGCYRQIGVYTIKKLALSSNRRGAERCRKIYSSLRCVESLSPEEVPCGTYKRDSKYHKKGDTKYRLSKKEEWIFSDPDGEDIIQEVSLALVQMAHEGHVFINPCQNPNKLIFDTYISRTGNKVSYFCKLYSVIENYLYSVKHTAEPLPPAWEGLDPDDRDEKIYKAYKLEYNSNTPIYDGGFSDIITRSDFQYLLEYITSHTSKKECKIVKNIIYWKAKGVSSTSAIAKKIGYSTKRTGYYVDRIYSLYHDWCHKTGGFSIKNRTSASYGVRMDAGTGSCATGGGYTEGPIDMSYTDGPCAVTSTRINHVYTPAERAAFEARWAERDRVRHEIWQAEQARIAADSACGEAWINYIGEYNLYGFIHIGSMMWINKRDIVHARHCCLREARATKVSKKRKALREMRKVYKCLYNK